MASDVFIWNAGLGRLLFTYSLSVTGKAGFRELEKYAIDNTIANTSGRQELLETILNKYIYEA